MVERNAVCAECGTGYEVELDAGESFDCQECGAEVTMPEAKPRARAQGAAARRGASSSSRRSVSSRHGNSGSSKSKMPLFVGGALLGVVAAVVAVIAATSSGDEGPEENGREEQAESASNDNGGSGAGITGDAVEDGNLTTKETDAASSLFDAASVSTEKTAGPTRKRVLGRDPRTLVMDKLTKHLGHLYLDDQVSAEIEKLRDDVERFQRERWDVDKELRNEHRRLTEAVSALKHDPFLERADSELNKYNIRFGKSDLHLRDSQQNLFDQPFEGFVHTPYIFFVQSHKDGKGEEIAARVHDELTQLKAAFSDYFGNFYELIPNRRHNIIKVMLFRGFGDYQNYNRIKEPDRDRNMTLAHYEPNARMLVVPLAYDDRLGKNKSEEQKQHDLREVMFHEGTHQLLHYFTDSKRGADAGHLSGYGAMWSDEGVAEFFGGHIEHEKGKFQFGKINSRIRSVAADGKNRKNRISFTKLLRWSRSEYERLKNEKFQDATHTHLHVYSQGWALVHFLNFYQNGKYKQRFEEVMKKQLETGDTGLPVFRKVFGDEFEKIEEEFDKYLDWLTDAHTQKRVKDGEIVPN